LETVRKADERWEGPSRAAEARQRPDVAQPAAREAGLAVGNPICVSIYETDDDGGCGGCRRYLAVESHSLSGALQIRLDHVTLAEANPPPHVRRHVGRVTHSKSALFRSKMLSPILVGGITPTDDGTRTVDFWPLPAAVAS